MGHTWEPLNEEEAVCKWCGIVMNEIEASPAQWNEDCPSTKGD